MIQQHFLRLSLISLLALPGCNHPLQPAPQPASETAPPQSAIQCPKPRPQPGQNIACPMNYLPVCAFHTDGSQSTASNACSACANPKIIGYTDTPCP